MKVAYVILACDSNPNYLQYWPVVAKAWTRRIGVHPILYLIEKPGETINIDDSLGTVIRFKAVDGIPTSMQAQCIRLLAPQLVDTDEFVIISDMDIIPIQEKFFQGYLADVDEKNWISYTLFCQMCYNAATPTIWKSVFNTDINDSSKPKEIYDIIKAKLIEWHAIDMGWSTDQYILRKNIGKTRQYSIMRKAGKVNRLARQVHKTSDIDLNILEQYIDYHLPRPYEAFKKDLDKIFDKLGVLN
jgi:hypothetical protein